jgi:hypothetical protein
VDSEHKTKKTSNFSMQRLCILVCSMLLITNFTSFFTLFFMFSIKSGFIDLAALELAPIFSSQQSK